MKIKRRILSLLLVAVLCFSSLATTAFAYAEDEDPESETISQETTSSTEEDVDLPPVETVPSVVAEAGSGFSEEGNLITRDLLFDKNTNKQFITVETRNGEIFYIVIDYDKPVDEDGDRYETYFLNLVDEADLQVLLEDADTVITCDCADKCVAGAVNTACGICSKNMTECVGAEKVPETEPTVSTEPSEPVDDPTEESNSTAILAVILIAAVVGGTAFFFLKKKKPDSKTKGKTDLDDYDYGMDDDDEYADFEAYEDEDDK